MTRTKRIDPAPETVEPGTALALPDTPVLIAAYGDPTAMDALLARIETDALALAPDLTTAASRKEIASLAFKVARSKTALDKIGADLIEDARKHVDAVNATRKTARDRLDALKVKVRAPLDAWEAAEAARVADLEDRLKDFTEGLPQVEEPSATIRGVLAEIEAIPVDETWEEYRERAATAKANAVHVLTERLRMAQQREAERAELERLRAEAAAREADEQRRLAEERRAAEAARIEREKIEAAERAARAAEERAAREKADAEARHQRELAAAAERERLATQRERERIEAEQAREAAARRAREADQARRDHVQDRIDDALQDLGVSVPVSADVTAAIMAGKIPHVKVEM